MRFDTAKRLMWPQRNAATDIINAFTRSKYVMLIAQMQSGKTGTFHGVANHMLRTGIVRRVYLICGTTDTQLRQQAASDTIQYNPDYYEDDNTGKFKVLFRQDLKKYNLKLQDTLIIIDESHIDSNKDQEMDRFLRENGIVLDGSNDRLEEKNTHILSVSATPFAEFSDYSYKERRKEMVFMKPGPTYRGVEFYLTNSLIKRTFKIEDHPRRFIDIVASKGARWNIVRVHNSKYEEELKSIIKDTAEENGIEIKLYSYNSNSTAGTFDLMRLESSPRKASILFIQGRLRCGKVVPKKHIGFVWDNSVSADSDTILQSLLGRMCGYEYDTEMPAEIYVNKGILIQKYIPEIKTSMNELQRYIYFMTNNGHIMPRKARNILADSVPVRNTAATKFAAHPIWFSNEDWDSEAGDSGYSQFIENIDMIRGEVERTGYNYSEEQFNEIMNNLDDIESGMLTHIPERRVGCHSQFSYFKSIVEESIPSEIVYRSSDNTVPPFVVVHTVIGEGHNTQYDRYMNRIYIVMQLNTPLIEGQVPMRSRIARTNGKEMFSQYLDETVDAVAIMGMGLSADACKYPLVFKTQLRYLINEWVKYKEGRTFGVKVSSTVSNLGDRFCIQFGERRLTGIIAQLERLCNVNIEVDSSSGEDGRILIKKIHWETF
jgi:hypothetical protein